MVRKMLWKLSNSVWFQFLPLGQKMLFTKMKRLVFSIKTSNFETFFF